MDDGAESVTQYLGSFITEQRRARIDAVLERRTRYLTIVLEDIFQSHNASAVLRSCECFGIQDVHIVEDRYQHTTNPDVALGASQWLDVSRYRASRGDTISTCCQGLREAGYRLVMASPEADGVDVDELSVEDPLAVLFGTEEDGLTPAARHEADESLRIPMFGFTESFNISVSAALILRELTQRIRATQTAWRLSEDEKVELRLKWYRQTVRGSDLLEQRFREQAEERG